MRFIGVVVSVCGVAALLTGCFAGGGDSAEEGESVTSAVHAESEAMSEVGSPAAFHFDSGDLVIGPFDPEEVKDNLFDPCAEISDAELAEVGLAKSEVQPDQITRFDDGMKYCALRSDDAYRSLAIAVMPTQMDALSARGVQVNQAGNPYMPNAFELGFPESNEDNCVIGFETQRGTLVVLAATVRAAAIQDELCTDVMRVHESLLRMQ